MGIRITAPGLPSPRGLAGASGAHSAEIEIRLAAHRAGRQPPSVVAAVENVNQTTSLELRAVLLIVVHVEDVGVRVERDVPVGIAEAARELVKTRSVGSASKHYPGAQNTDARAVAGLASVACACSGAGASNRPGAP